jgi:hypothetical protein
VRRASRNASAAFGRVGADLNDLAFAIDNAVSFPLVPAEVKDVLLKLKKYLASKLGERALPAITFSQVNELGVNSVGGRVCQAVLYNSDQVG